MKLELQKELVRICPTWFEHCWVGGVGEGWFDLLRRLLEDMKELDLPPEFRIDQVKEKFGGLRFYVNFSTPELDRLIALAEEESTTTCEVCGKMGESRSSGYWITTRCETHAEKRNL